jgi:VirE N-terminal domain
MTQTPLAAHVSLFHGSTHTTPVETLPLGEVLQRIQNGTYRNHTERLRRILREKGKPPYDNAKRHSPGFTPAGTFTTRANANLDTPSQVLNFDFDHVTNLPDALTRLRQDPWVVYAFISPSGDGLKVGVWASGIRNDTTYKHAWATVLSYGEHTYPAVAIANDRGCKDIARLCYVSWDPACYTNPSAQCFAVPPPAPARVPTPTPPAPRDERPARRQGYEDPWSQRSWHAKQVLETARQMIAASAPPTATSAGNRHETRLRAARLVGGYVGGGILSYGEAYAALEAIVKNYTDNLANALRPIRAGLAYGEAAPITLEDLEQERQAYRQAHGIPERTVPDITQSPVPTAAEPDPDDPEQAPVGWAAHVLPDHIKNHPDPRVRRYWGRVYRRTNALKQRRIQEGLLPCNHL